MKMLNQSIALTLLAGTFTLVSAQPADTLQPGPIPFSAFDIDRNGAISEQEFDSVRAERMASRARSGRSLRYSSNAPSFADFDLNGDEQLSPQELAAGHRVQMQKRSGMRGPGMGSGPGMGRGAGMGRNRPTFSEFDLNGDGVLVEDEFYEARGTRISERAKAGYRLRGLSSAPPFSEIDADGDGKVGPAEFSAAQLRHRQSRFK